MKWAYDKPLTYRLAAEADIDFTWTYFPAGREDICNLNGPMVMKPAVMPVPPSALNTIPVRLVTKLLDINGCRAPTRIFAACRHSRLSDHKPRVAERSMQFLYTGTMHFSRYPHSRDAEPRVLP